MSYIRRVLIIDDDRDDRDDIEALLGGECDCDQAPGAEQAFDLLEFTPYHVILLDIEFRGRDEGFDILTRLIREYPHIPVIMVTKFADKDKLIRAVKLGAVQYVYKDRMVEELPVAMEKVLHEVAVMRARRKWLQDESDIDRGIIGKSEAVVALRGRISELAGTDLSVLITGEMGTGKDLAAEWIHRLSKRSMYPFREINCAETTDELAASMLFGHDKGAFTDAKTAKPGAVELANGGTVFINEIGDLTPANQTRLLNVIDKKQFYRLGGHERLLSVDVRYITATNRDILSMISRKEFRADLYQRFKQDRIEIPPLRDRRDDIPLLVEHFVNKHARDHGRVVPVVRAEVMEFLSGYDWPGNVRELSNVVDRAVQLNRSGTLFVKDFLPSWSGSPEKVKYQEYTDSCQRNYLIELMERYEHKVAEVSRHAGLSREHTYRRLKELGISLGKTPESGQ